jgi:glutamyl-tRNA synthetase
VLVHERVGTLAEGADMLAFLFLDDVVYDEADVAKVLDADGLEVVAAAHDALTGVTQWTTAAIEEALRTSLVEQRGLKPRVAFGPVRVAVTGRRISPPLFESLELLGRAESLARLETAPHAAHGAGS